MSAAELRQAAETLRDRATMATPGPWEAGERCIWGLSRSPSRDYEVVTDGPGGEGGVGSTDDAAYIATMHPGVGLALARWLDKAGADWFAFGDEDHHRPEHEACAYCDDDPYGPHLRSALTIARLINGGAA